MHATSPKDAELTQAYVRLKEQLRAHLRGRGVDAVLAADVVQEVFIKALAQQQAGRTIANLNGWLYAAVRNAAVDHLRAMRPSVPLDEDIAAESAYDVQLHAAIADCLRPLMARLPAIYRDTLLAVDLDGRSMREVAQLEGVSVSAVKSRASRARRMLKQSLLHCCVLEFEDGLVAQAALTGLCACEPPSCTQKSD